MWSSSNGDDIGTPLDEDHNIDDISHETLKKMSDDCLKFCTDYAELIKEALDSSTNDLTDIAHDFWLTRNRHGAGFWDGDYPKALGSSLTEAAHSFGEFDLYIGDDGLIYS